MASARRPPQPVVAVRMRRLDPDVYVIERSSKETLKVLRRRKATKDLARRLVPAEVIDRPKGYFPVPALRHLDGDLLSLVGDTLYSPAAKTRGLFRPEYVDALFARPDQHTERTGANKLWQLALLELWLQTHGIG